MSTKQAERTKAADQIMRLLTLLEPTGSAQDERVRAELIGEALDLYKPIFKGADKAPLAPLPDIPPKVRPKGPHEPCTCFEEQLEAMNNLPPIDFSCHDCGGTPGLKPT